MNSLSPNFQDIPISIVGSNTFGRYPKISVAETWNAFVSDDALVSFAGYKFIAQFKQLGKGRDIYTSVKFGHMIAVVDDSVYTIDRNYGIAKIGTLFTTRGNVFIAENDNNQIGIVDGVKVYIFNYANFTFNTITVDFAPTYISFQDGYFIASNGLGNTWRLSAPNDGTSWVDGPNTVGLLQSKPDLTQATVVLNRQLFVMGKTVSESWFDTGQQLFPYQRNDYYSVDYGCLNASSIATGFDKMVWVGANEKSGPTIMVTTGAAPEQLSNDGINYKLASLQNPQDCYGFIFRQDGHVFYVSNFFTDNITYIYDFNTKQFYTISDFDLSCHPARKIAAFNNSYFFVSFKDGNLYELNSKYTTANGHIIPRFRICDHIRLPNNTRFVLNNIFLTMESGESSDIGKIGLSLSMDGGVSFGSILHKNLPPLGSRQNTIRYWGLGSGNDIVPKFAWWGTNRLVVNNAIGSIYQ